MAAMKTSRYPHHLSHHQSWLKPRPIVQRCAVPHASSSSSDAATSVSQGISMIDVQATSPQGVASFQVESGQEILRAALMSQKVDLYNTWGKVMNCGGGGSCGTCVVEVTEGADLLSERTPAEDKKLKGKPATWRLACQSVVGDGTCAGKVAVRTQPKA